MGLIEPFKAAWVVNAVEKALDDLGRIKYSGLANKVFNEVYFNDL